MGFGLFGLNIANWIEGTPEEIKAKLDAGYTAPAYYQNAKQESQQILTERNNNFILTNTYGL